MRMPSLMGPGGLTQLTDSWARLTVAAHHIFEGGELLGAHRSARMHFARADANLRAHAELATIGELGRGVPQHNGRVDAVHEDLGGSGIFSDYGIGGMRAVMLDMAY